MGLPYRAYYLEAEPLKLTAQHFPLPSTLRELVREVFADPDGAASGAQAMALDELLGYLRNTEDLSLSPLQSVLAQTESIGDPALPTHEQIATLHWVGTAFRDWEDQFPLEEPLASQLRRLKPLAAALALTDANFFVPGGHPLHQLLDNLQLAAVGWQARLGRAGHLLEKQVATTVDSALTWLQAGDTDLAQLCQQVATSTERDKARADRMVQRMIETELGRMKTAAAKRHAAEMINAALHHHPAPPKIAEFLQGAWYESAQLVLLKYGQDSDEWKQMSATTANLLDSLQPAGEDDPARRQHIFEVVTKLPKDLKRWLLSLQHDSDGVNDAIGLVEFVHLRILRKQPLELGHTLPIPVAQARTVARTAEVLASISEGQWFSVRLADGDTVRARLALRLEDEQRLLFANQAGVKILQPSFAEFETLLEKGGVVELDSGASFSRSLARAVGISTTEDLESFLDTLDDRVKRATEEQERLRLEQERLEQERLERERLEQERLKQERLEQERLEQARLKQERLERERLEQARLEQARLEQERLEQERRERERLERERLEQAHLEQERLERERLQRRRDDMQRLHEQQQEEERRREQLAELAQQQKRRGPQQGAAPLAGAGNTPGDLGAAELDLSMGAWLGFHDGSTPLLAKLAVYDLENDSYIFVNRLGIKMRQLGKQALLQLMADGLVDILETRPSFREEVSRLKNQDEV